MIETETMKAKPLTKQTALDYLQRRGKAVTAKELAIDMDSRASTASELLERMTAQGLVERDQKQRPREYVLTDAGRKRLEFFRSGAESNPDSASDPESNPGSEEEREEAATVNVSELKQEVARQFEGLREDVRDLFDALRLNPSPGESPREHADRIKRKLESSAEEAKAKALHETVCNLYRARYELRSLRWLDSKDEVKARIAELQSSVGKEAAEQIERLVLLEGEIRDDSDAEKLQGVPELRDALHLSASVFGRRNKDTGAE